MLQLTCYQNLQLQTHFISTKLAFDRNNPMNFRLLKPFFDNVLLEHDGLPCVLPPAVYLDLGHLHETLGDSGL